MGCVEGELGRMTSVGRMTSAPPVTPMACFANCAGILQKKNRPWWCFVLIIGFNLIDLVL